VLSCVRQFPFIFPSQPIAKRSRFFLEEGSHSHLLSSDPLDKEADHEELLQQFTDKTVSTGTPIHNRPNPVNSAISSPYRERLVPARMITTALIRNTPYAVSTARPLPTQ
jgi:hypothetical protein